MPSISKTKSGKKFRAPTDQARKQERKKENKRNKKDRQQIRHAMAKFFNLEDTIEQLLVLERQILNLDPRPFHIEVLNKKKKVLSEMLFRRRHVLQTSKEDNKLKMFNQRLAEYTTDCKKLAHLAEQAKLAQNVDLDSISLPVGAPMPIPMAFAPIKKKVDFKLPNKNQKPPGPPVGIALEMSDGEEENDYDFEEEIIDDEDLAPVPIPIFDEPHSSVHYNYPPTLAPRKIPGPPSLPYPGIPFHEPPQILLAREAVISSAPQIRRDQPQSYNDGEEANAVLMAAPELRNLRKETVKLVPTQLMRKNNKPARPVPVRRPQAAQQAKSTDEAYNDFMKELDGLI